LKFICRTTASGISTDPILERLLKNDCGIWFDFENMYREEPERAVQELRELDHLKLFKLSFEEVQVAANLFIESKKSRFAPASGQNLDDPLSGPSFVEASVDLVGWYKTEVNKKLVGYFEGLDQELNHLSHNEMRLFKLDPLSTLSEKLPGGDWEILVREN
jgi:hypothetical protein